MCVSRDIAYNPRFYCLPFLPPPCQGVPGRVVDVSEPVEVWNDRSLERYDFAVSGEVRGMFGRDVDRG
jgi:hypothetical protein